MPFSSLFVYAPCRSGSPQGVRGGDHLRASGFGRRPGPGSRRLRSLPRERRRSDQDRRHRRRQSECGGKTIEVHTDAPFRRFGSVAASALLQFTVFRLVDVSIGHELASFGLGHAQLRRASPAPRHLKPTRRKTTAGTDTPNQQRVPHGHEDRRHHSSDHDGRIVSPPALVQTSVARPRRPGRVQGSSARRGLRRRGGDGDPRSGRSRPRHRHRRQHVVRRLRRRHRIVLLVHVRADRGLRAVAGAASLDTSAPIRARARKSSTTGAA